MSVRSVAAVVLVSLASGCAFPTKVQKMGVDYNTAVAGMADEVTLLNIVRAKRGMPIHYTGVSRISGSITVSGTASVNGVLKGEGITDETTRQTVGATITDTVKNVVAEGVDAYTPSVGGTISSGPSFDVAVFDTQKFYRGILAPVPADTIANFIDQGFKSDVLMRLFVIRIDFTLKEDTPGYGKKGDLVGPVYVNDVDSTQAFVDQTKCYSLNTGMKHKAAVKLAPVSRLLGEASRPNPLSIEELSRVDGEKLEFDGEITPDPSEDSKVFLVRPSSDKIALRFLPNPKCVSERLTALQAGSPPSDAFYLGDGKMLGATLDNENRGVPFSFSVNTRMTLRSTEGAIRYLGRYLRQKSPIAVGKSPLFSVVEGKAPAGRVISTTLLGIRYSIAQDDNLERNMEVIALIEQLINLQKEATDKPTTVPVQVIP